MRTGPENQPSSEFVHKGQPDRERRRKGAKARAAPHLRQAETRQVLTPYQKFDSIHLIIIILRLQQRL